MSDQRFHHAIVRKPCKSKLNGTVIMPSGFPNAKNIIASEGYHVIEVDLSEFQKPDGGASCLSLRF